MESNRFDEIEFASRLV